MRVIATRPIKVADVMLGERLIEPTEANINKMAESLQTNGQKTPVAVIKITKAHFKLIAGATRFKAAKKLHWKEIRAEVWNGSDIDCGLHEAVENLDRHDLTAEQRKTVKHRYDELLAEKLRLAVAEPSTGGRGKKGGLREAARQAGVPRSTAQRMTTDKPAQIPKNGPVSNPAPQQPSQPSPSTPPRSVEAKKRADTSPMGKTATTKLTITWSVSEDQRFASYQKHSRHNRSQCARRIVNDFLDQALSAKKAA